MVNTEKGKIIQISTYISQEDYEWLKSHDINKSSLLRKLIETFIDKAKERENDGI